MKQDRPLRIIFSIILILIGIALALFFTRQHTLSYTDDVSPRGTVHNYVVALLQKDYEKAYSFLKDGEYKPSFDNFRNAFLTGQVDITSTSLEIGTVQQNGDQATVDLLIIHNSTDPFTSGYNESTNATLIRDKSGSWKIATMPYPYWNWDWYNPPVELQPKPGTD
ncbi:MAG: hypothetical protein ACPL3P_03760 [Anaerolineales bacterium]